MKRRPRALTARGPRERSSYVALLRVETDLRVTHAPVVDVPEEPVVNGGEDRNLRSALTIGIGAADANVQQLVSGIDRHGFARLARELERIGRGAHHDIVSCVYHAVQTGIDGAGRNVHGGVRLTESARVSLPVIGHIDRELKLRSVLVAGIAV